jgi:hypothetical protein
MILKGNLEALTQVVFLYLCRLRLVARRVQRMQTISELLHLTHLPISHKIASNEF